MSLAASTTVRQLTHADGVLGRRARHLGPSAGAERHASATVRLPVAPPALPSFEILSQDDALQPPPLPTSLPTPVPTTVADLPRLRRARVVAVAGADATAERLVVLGFAPGTLVSFVRRAPFAGPLVVELRGAQICVRVSEARRVLVVPVAAP